MKKLKLEDPIIHDHTDRDVVAISKYYLQSLLTKARLLQNAETNTLAFLSLSIAFIFAGVATETFRTFGPIPGEGLRSVSLILGIVCAAYAAVYGLRWMRLHKSESIEQTIDSLTKGYSFPVDFLYGKTKKNDKVTERNKV